MELIIKCSKGIFLYPGDYYVNLDGNVCMYLQNCNHHIILHGMGEEEFKDILHKHEFNKLITFDIENEVSVISKQ